MRLRGVCSRTIKSVLATGSADDGVEEGEVTALIAASLKQYDGKNESKKGKFIWKSEAKNVTYLFILFFLYTIEKEETEFFSEKFENSQLQSFVTINSPNSMDFFWWEWNPFNIEIFIIEWL